MPYGKISVLDKVHSDINYSAFDNEINVYKSTIYDK